jgi:hypothetical protein
LRRARICYDHLAGELGVALTDALVRRGAVLFGPNGGTLTPSGAALFDDLHVELDAGGRGALTLGFSGGAAFDLRN